MRHGEPGLILQDPFRGESCPMKRADEIRQREGEKIRDKSRQKVKVHGRLKSTSWAWSEK